MNDILLDDDNDLIFSGGDFEIGESTLQEVSIILELNQGEVKEDPILGPGLVRLIKGRASVQRMKSMVKLHLLRDGKNYNEIKKYINTKINTNG